MNRIGITTLLLIFVIVLCGFELFKINCISNKVINDLNLIQQFISNGDMSEAKQLSNDIYEFWENNTVILAMFVQHDSLENIEESLALMNSAIEQQDINNFWYESSKTLVQINNLNDTEYPKIENIL